MPIKTLACLGLVVVLALCLGGDGLDSAQSLIVEDNWGPHVYVYRDAPQTIPDATNTVVVFEPAQGGADGDDLFDPASPTMFTMPEYDAIYLITAQVCFDWPGGNGHCSVYIEEKTGTRDWERRGAVRIPSPDAGQAMVSCVIVIGVNAGDHVRMVVRQTSGGPLDIVADQYSRPKFSATFLRPQYCEVLP